MSTERGELLEVASTWAMGLGIIVLALAPLAIPILALTAVALLPLVLPLVALGLVAAVVLASIRLIRGSVRRIGTHLHPTRVPSEGRAPAAPITGRLGISSRS